MVSTPKEQPDWMSKAELLATLDRANKLIGEQADEMSALQTQLDESDRLLRKLLKAVIDWMKDVRKRNPHRGLALPRRTERAVWRVVEGIKRRLGIE